MEILRRFTSATVAETEETLLRCVRRRFLCVLFWRISAPTHPIICYVLLLVIVGAFLSHIFVQIVDPFLIWRGVLFYVNVTIFIHIE